MLRLLRGVGEIEGWNRQLLQAEYRHLGERFFEVGEHRLPKVAGDGGVHDREQEFLLIQSRASQREDVAGDRNGPVNQPGGRPLGDLPHENLVRREMDFPIPASTGTLRLLEQHELGWRIDLVAAHVAASEDRNVVSRELGGSEISVAVSGDQTAVDRSDHFKLRVADEFCDEPPVLCIDQDIPHMARQFSEGRLRCGNAEYGGVHEPLGQVRGGRNQVGRSTFG